MVLWFTTLDCAGLAAYVIWTCKNPDWNARKSQQMGCQSPAIPSLHSKESD
ncbi:hypothetical protein T09_1600 [Trichinella sp. T9]|nr:hypothetical protein T09_1600 [Trichinella sp. T9]